MICAGGQAEMGREPPGQSKKREVKKKNPLCKYAMAKMVSQSSPDYCFYFILMPTMPLSDNPTLIYLSVLIPY